MLRGARDAKGCKRRKMGARDTQKGAKDAIELVHETLRGAA